MVFIWNTYFRQIDVSKICYNLVLGCCCVESFVKTIRISLMKWFFGMTLSRTSYFLARFYFHRNLVDNITEDIQLSNISRWMLCTFRVCESAIDSHWTRITRNITTVWRTQVKSSWMTFYFNSMILRKLKLLFKYADILFNTWLLYFFCLFFLI